MKDCWANGQLTLGDKLQAMAKNSQDRTFRIIADPTSYEKERQQLKEALSR